MTDKLVGKRKCNHNIARDESQQLRPSNALVCFRNAITLPLPCCRMFPELKSRPDVSAYTAQVDCIERVYSNSFQFSQQQSILVIDGLGSIH